MKRVTACDKAAVQNALGTSAARGRTRSILINTMVTLGCVCILTFLLLLTNLPLLAELDGFNPLHLLAWCVGAGTLGGALLGWSIHLSLVTQPA